MEWGCAQQRYTRRKQTLSAQPKACFATTASGSCLCVLEGSSVTMHLANGDTHVVALPCKAVGLWALPAGVLVEPPRADGGPVAHLLNEPLEELRTVVMTRASASAEPPGDILLSSARAPLVLTHQPRARAHALWRVAGGGTPGGAAELAAWWEQPAGSAASAAESSFFAPEDGGAGVGELPLLLCVAQPERELLHVYSLGHRPPRRHRHAGPSSSTKPLPRPAPRRASLPSALPAVAAQPVRGCGARRRRRRRQRRCRADSRARRRRLPGAVAVRQFRRALPAPVLERRARTARRLARSFACDGHGRGYAGGGCGAVDALRVCTSRR